METTGERQPNNRVRSEMGWTKAGAWAALVTLVLFVVVNWHWCWLFRNKLRDLAGFFYAFAWLVLFFVLRTRWRFVLLIVTIPVIAVLIGTGFWGISEMNAGPEAAAFQALQQMQSSLRAYRVEHQQQEYPAALPSMSVSPSAQKYYRFEYVPKRSASGEIVGYLIQATPTRRDCEFHRSFTITDDGSRVFWTMEPRAATLSDMWTE